MRRILSIYFTLSLLIGTGIYIAQKLQVKLPNIVQFYLNDFLIIPILLTVSLIILRRSRKDKKYQIPIWVVLYICMVYAFLFEYVLPKFNPRYTADIIDVVLYFISGFIFSILQKTTKNMKPRLIILSDLWGNENAKWLSLYVNELSVKYEVKVYDSCLLAGITNLNLSEEERHLFFVDKGIDNAVNELLRLEKKEVTILAFSIGGTIGWKAILIGMKVVSFTSVSATRLRYEIEKPFCDVMLYYGELDNFKPKKVWFKSNKNVHYKVVPNKKHTMYKDVEIINKVCLKLLN